MNLLATYLQDLNEIHSTGSAVPETAYYGALERLLTAVGASLKPKVRCVLSIQNQGAGLPDGGLFTEEQVKQMGDVPAVAGQLPSRGVIEVKGVGANASLVADSEQVERYWQRYRQVLVTNYKDFVLVGQDAYGDKVVLEKYSLAPNEVAFWQLAGTTKTLSDDSSDQFTDFLLRVCLHAAPLTSPADVAWFLASYAREARHRVATGNASALTVVRSAIEDTLGMKFQGDKGDRFFQSTLVQTLFYGIFSAWVLWCKRNMRKKTPFNWRLTAWELRVPMIRSIFYQLAEPGSLGDLQLVEVLDWATDVLNRVDRPVFFERFEENHAVQYFYEPFLQAFDPELRKQLGVWYTPPEIVEYMVERVDSVLRTELGIADGLADNNVIVLDPCCGTGAYLVEVLKRIGETLGATGGDALAAHEVKRAAVERVFGFEILPAPFVVSHLQIGLMLESMGASLSTEGERAGVYLTNALTGWEPPKEPKELLFREFQKERDMADHIKRDARVLVVIGNPPYNGVAGVAVDEERALSDAYRTTKNVASPQGHGLNDLYVRFFSMADRRIVEETGSGIVCFISNYSWLDGLSFTGMRERYLEVFDQICIDNLNGDKYRTGKVTPEGLPDPSVFSAGINKEGIQVGTAIALMTRKEDHKPTKSVHYRSLWGKRKREELLDTLGEEIESEYQTINPQHATGLAFAVSNTAGSYLAWPLLTDIIPASFPGIKTSRDEALVDIDLAALTARMAAYFDPAVSDLEMGRLSPKLMQNTSLFQAATTRQHLQRRGPLPDSFIRFTYRPFDVRWLYWESDTKLLDRNRTEYMTHVAIGNKWVAAAQQNRKEYGPPVTSNVAASLHVIERGANLFPLLLRKPAQQTLTDDGLPVTTNGWRPNLSDRAVQYLLAVGSADEPERLFYHALAIQHSKQYALENSTALRQDWPRIPLPATFDDLQQSAELGELIATLLDPDAEAPLSHEISRLAVISRVGGGSLDPAQGDLAVTAGWGSGGSGRVTMPGSGKVIARDYSPAELHLLGESLSVLGDQAVDIYLNAAAYWSCVPLRVWEYTIGGYKVLKKWLSYRERSVLGRDLSADEVYAFTKIARHIAELLLTGPELDKNYEAVKAATWDW